MRSRYRTCAIASLTLAYFIFLSLDISQAKDWDVDQAKYLPDSDIAGLAGPVRKVTESVFERTALVSVTKISFDPNGNITQLDTTNFKDGSCTESRQSYDAGGHRQNGSFSQGQTPPGGTTCENLTLMSRSTYTYEFNARNFLSAQRVSFTFPPQAADRVSKYIYDSDGRLIQADTSIGSNDRISDTYTYTSDQRGLHVIRKHTSSLFNGSYKMDLTRDAIYDTDGRLLEVAQTPAVVLGSGSESLTYSNSKYLIEKRFGDFIMTFSRHDRYGNWTVSVDTQGGHSTRLIEY